MEHRANLAATGSKVRYQLCRFLAITAHRHDVASALHVIACFNGSSDLWADRQIIRHEADLRNAFNLSISKSSRSMVQAS
jgi:hypothetical protein